VEWNEYNCDVTENIYIETAYNRGKWAFVADFFRFKILYENGGIYLDTDMMIYKSLDSFLNYDTFFGIESYQYVNGSIIGSKLGAEVIRLMQKSYTEDKYNKGNVIIVERITDILQRYYSLKLTGETQYLSDNIAVFSPNIFTINVSDGNCMAEHLYDASWTVSNSSGSYRYEVLKLYFTNPYANSLNFGTKALLKRIMFFKLKMLLPDCIYYWLKRIMKKRQNNVQPVTTAKQRQLLSSKKLSE
jgi:mannosyltransferase OCH1-like enzyme